jgi:filamentous hemagglutinin
LKDINGKFNYVVLENGNLVVGKKGDLVGGGHIDLAGGNAVSAAGEVRVYQGNIKYIDNSSGHYEPNGASAQQAAEKAFQDIGFKVEGKYIEKVWVPDPKLKRGGAWRPVNE